MSDATRPDDGLHAARTADFNPVQQRVLELRLAMQTDWKRGQRQGVEHYLLQYPELAGNDDAVLDCIYGEFVLREEMGDQPDPEEYGRRFPRLADPLRRLFAVDRALVGEGQSSTTNARGGETMLAAADALPSHPEKTARPGTKAMPAAIGKYRVVSVLDSGGQGTVYRAVHPTLGKDVVIKLACQSCSSPEEQNHLLHEGRMLAELDHPHLARVYDFDFHEGRPFLVMEFIRGRTLEQYAAQRLPSPRQSAGLVAQAARALTVAHCRGITHRDLKPQNLLIDDNGQVRVIDFGLAQWRDAWQNQVDPAGTLAGTVHYMAPEQASGNTAGIGPHTDVYALGAVLCYLLTGKPPVEGRSLSDVLGKVKAGAVNLQALEQRGVPRRMQALCRRVLSCDPQQRPATAAALADELEAACRSHWMVRRAVLVAVPLVLVLAGFVVWWAASQETGKAPPVPVVSGAPGPVTTSTVKMSPLMYNARMPTLFLDVSEGADEVPGKLTSRLPVLTGHYLRAKVKAPAGLYVTLFELSSSGQLKELARQGPTADGELLYFPAKEATAFVELQGPTGTECWLACGNRSGFVTVNDLQKVWPKAGTWPTLPDRFVYRLIRGDVLPEADSRDIGEVKKSANPAGEVVQFLEQLDAALRPRVDYYEGLAFCLKNKKS
jgi:predicted Ser/Thr protein kinase